MQNEQWNAIPMPRRAAYLGLGVFIALLPLQWFFYRLLAPPGVFDYFAMTRLLAALIMAAAVAWGVVGAVLRRQTGSAKPALPMVAAALTAYIVAGGQAPSLAGGVRDVAVWYRLETTGLIGEPAPLIDGGKAMRAAARRRVNR
jgi:hypothetical protein